MEATKELLSLKNIVFDFVLANYHLYKNDLHVLPNDLKDVIAQRVRELENMDPQELVDASKKSKAVVDFIVNNEHILVKLGGTEIIISMFFKPPHMYTTDQNNVIGHNIRHDFYLYDFCNNEYAFKRARDKDILKRLGGEKKAYLTKKFEKKPSYDIQTRYTAKSIKQ
jgi:hypothetical protein